MTPSILTLQSRSRDIEYEQGKPTCVICGDSPALWCLKCESTAYFSEKCYESDKPIHSQLCMAMHDLGCPPKRPHPDQRLAIIFPANKSEPKLIFVRSEWITENSTTDNVVTITGQSKMKLKKLLGIQKGGEEKHYLTSMNNGNDAELDYTLFITCVADRDQLPVNACVTSLTGNSPPPFLPSSWS